MKTMIVLFAVAALSVANGQWQQGGWANTWAGNQGAPAPVQDTPEVAAAKAAHFAAVAQAQVNSQHQGYNAPVAAPVHYQGPVALPPGFDAHGAPLPVQDTPEVAAAKAAQLNALASAGGHVPAQTWAAPAPVWNAPAAPAGVPADTPEVAAAKAAHLAAHQAASVASHGQRWRRSVIAAPVALTSYPGSTAPSYTPPPSPRRPLVHHAPYRSWGYSTLGHYGWY